MPNTVSKIAILYGILWLLSFWFQNIVFSTIISGFGVIILVVLAIGLDGLFADNDENNTKLKYELEGMRKEINELKHNKQNA